MGVSFGLSSVFITAAIKALPGFAALNASIEANDGVFSKYPDIAIAVSTEP